MLLRLNQYFFGSIIFSLQSALTASLFYITLFSIYSLLAKPSEYSIWNMLFGSGVYVFVVSFLCSLLAFTLSIFFKRQLNRLNIKNESFLIATIAAIPAIIISILIIQSVFSILNTIIYVAGFLSIYVTSFIYRSTWNTLVRIKSVK